MILVTGASGFVGADLVEAFAAGGARVRAAYRGAPVRFPAQSIQSIMIGDLGPATDWAPALDGVTGIVHLAGPAHAKHADAALRRAIVEGTASLAAQAARAGVERFVFVSSIKAAAACTEGAPVSERTAPAPEDAYGRAKLEAEQAVFAHASLRPVVLRPPLVVAAHAKGNLARLLRLADTPAPLPLGGLTNKRSIVSLASLIEAIGLAVRAPPSVSGIFHVADETALSTSAIVAALRAGMGRPTRLFAGARSLLPRALTESLEVDAGAFRAATGWVGADARAALVACGAAWRQARQRR
jgi:UDP-glucose 4-epimerase